jgi:DNA mismatch endonuclease, patch repair protein
MRDRRWPGVDPVRAKTMASVRHKHTTPERVVRRLLHAMGYRFRLHDRHLPGTPDIVFRTRKKVIYVHGCFWHGHDCRHGRRQPRTNELYWRVKIEKNRARDIAAARALSKMGWRMAIVWECETHSLDSLKSQLAAFLGSTGKVGSSND